MERPVLITIIYHPIKEMEDTAEMEDMPEMVDMPETEDMQAMVDMQEDTMINP